MKDFEVVLKTKDPTVGYPRNFSLYALAAILGRVDIPLFIKELRDSYKVAVSFCRWVKAPVFHAYDYNTPDHKLNADFHWDANEGRIIELLKTHSYPEVKGFGRFPEREEVVPLSKPLEDKDAAYAKLIIYALEKEGYKVSPELEKYRHSFTDIFCRTLVFDGMY